MTSRAPSSALCGRHGLRYDPKVSSGCSRCVAQAESRSEPDARSYGPLLVLALLAASGGVGWVLLRERAPDATPSTAPVMQAASVSAQPKASGGGYAAIEGALTTRNAADRSGAFFVPAHAESDRLPVMVAMHGTGGSGEDMVQAFRELASARKFVIVAPSSRRSPAGELTWEVGDKPGDVTPDLTHVLACLQEVAGTLGTRIDRSRVLAVGHSGGASLAPYVATNREPFSSFAVLHGGVYTGGLGTRAVRGWFSTGTEDGLRPPAMVRKAQEDTRAAGVADAVYREYPGGHDLSSAEREALIAWWLGS